jgi:hypothetical protein
MKPLVPRRSCWSATMAKRDVDLMQSHSVDEATARHRMKHGRKDGGRKS